VFRYSHSSPNIIWVIKFRIVGWVDYVARTECWQFPSAYHKVGIPLGRRRRMYEDDIKMYTELSVRL